MEKNKPQGEIVYDVVVDTWYGDSGNSEHVALFRDIKDAKKRLKEEIERIKKEYDYKFSSSDIKETKESKRYTASDGEMYGFDITIEIRKRELI